MDLIKDLSVGAEQHCDQSCRLAHAGGSEEAAVGPRSLRERIRRLAEVPTNFGWPLQHLFIERAGPCDRLPLTQDFGVRHANNNPELCSHDPEVAKVEPRLQVDASPVVRQRNPLLPLLTPAAHGVAPFGVHTPPTVKLPLKSS